MGRRFATLVAILAAAGATGCDRSRRTPTIDTDDAGPSTPKPRLVVLLVVDQLPTWTFTRDRAHFDGGFDRLLTEGAYYSHGEIPYGSSYTSPGHAAIATGAAPDVTGVIGNFWYDRMSKRTRSASADPGSATLWLSPIPATRPPRGGSGASLLVEGVGDVLRRETGDKGRAVAVGLKQRASVFVLGQKPNLALWYDASQPRITTSTAYAPEAPEWLSTFAGEEPSEERLGLSWQPLSAERLAAITELPDDCPGESAIYGLGTTFPHDVAQGMPPGSALRATPAGTDLVFDAAKAAIVGESLGADDTPDILALTISSHDYAGHYWGQESWERLDLSLRLDHSLGEFIGYLDRHIGKDRWAMVMTSDHGATRMVERSGGGARRIPVSELLTATRRAAESVAGPGAWVGDFAANTVYMSSAFHKLPAKTRNRALDEAERQLKSVAGVQYARRVDQIRGGCDARTGLDALACRAVYPGRSGDLYVGAAENCLTARGYATGTSHGSPNPDDRFVPIIVLEPGKGASTTDEPTSLLRVAPTLSRLLGISPPGAATQPSL